MLYALSGDFRIYINGNYHEFASGDFVLINSREVHQIDAISENGGSYLVVRFLPELIYDGISQSHFELKYLLPFITENSVNEKVIKASILSERNSSVPERMQDIINEATEQEYGYELAIKNQIGGIYLWLLRYWHTSENNPLFLPGSAVKTTVDPRTNLYVKTLRPAHRGIRDGKAVPFKLQLFLKKFSSPDAHEV